MAVPEPVEGWSLSLSKGFFENSSLRLAQGTILCVSKKNFTTTNAVMLHALTSK